MLIMSDTQRLRVGIASLDQRCAYCSKPLHAYPLIMGDDVAHSVYHAGCAVELAMDILVAVSDPVCKFVILPLRQQVEEGHDPQTD